MNMMKYPVAVLSMLGGFVWASGGDSVDNVPQEALGVYEAYTKASNAMINRAREEYKTRLNQFLKAKMKTDDWDTMIQIKKKINQLEQPGNIDVQEEKESRVAIPGVWGDYKNNLYWLDNDNTLVEHLPGKQVNKTPEVMDPAKSSADYIVFQNSDAKRAWIRIDEKTLGVFSRWGVTILNLQADKETGKQDILARLENEYKANCKKYCGPLSAKYINELEKIRIKLVNEGRMDDVFTLHEMINKEKTQFSSMAPVTGKWPANQFVGTWQGTGKKEIFTISPDGKVVCSSPGKSENISYSYVTSSPHGFCHTFKSSDGKVRYFCILDGKLFVFTNSNELDRQTYEKIR